MKTVLLQLRNNPRVIFGLAILLFWICAAFLGPLVVPFSYTEMDMENQMSAPGQGGHFLGTDDLGRDVFSRIIYGSRSILSIALMTSLLSSIA
ncbi:MAG: hypothetical protein PF508_03485, partial [Spirochaeta sp.]|nr:hypothetical protein [Spirochaeta sp.]